MAGIHTSGATSSFLLLQCPPGGISLIANLSGVVNQLQQERNQIAAELNSLDQSIHAIEGLSGNSSRGRRSGRKAESLLEGTRMLQREGQELQRPEPKKANRLDLA